MDLSAYRPFITELALRSGEFIKPYFANPSLVVEIKSDESPVTVADRGAEELMRRMIKERFPSHGIIGEEHGSERADADWVWVLDPIDGTKSFATACPLFGTLIALQYQGRPVLGAIHQPILGQLMIGDSRTTELNGRPVRCRSIKSLAEATFLTSDPINPHKYQNGAAYEAFTRRCRIVRTWGDCYGYLLVASAWADIMCDPIMNPWDIAALIPVIEGAGGVITDWQGGSAVGAASTVASGSRALHDQVVAGLNGR